MNITSLYGPLTTISGTVSHLRETTTVSGHMHNGHGRISSRTQTSFRIGRQAVEMATNVALFDGDVITAAGVAGGVFQVLAVRNDVTGHVYTQPRSLVLGALVVVLSLPLLFILVGFVLLPIGLLVVWQHRRVGHAIELLRTTEPARLVEGAALPTH